MKSRATVIALALFTVALTGSQCGGLNIAAYLELQDAGVDQYLGQFSAVVAEDVGGGWTKHTFDPEGGDGPICIAGTPYSAFTRAANPTKVVLFLDGGGACWQDFYFCSILAGDEDPALAGGVFADSFDTGTEVIDNPLDDWSIVFGSYCDGSVWSGDNDVVDPNFPFGPVRFHRGLRNLSATVDLAQQVFPNAQQILVTGSSAGGVGAAGFAPFLVRFAFGNQSNMTVLNDAGPVATNPGGFGAADRAADWQFDQFYPASCDDCDPLGSATPIIDWRLENDSTVREAFYSTDGDATNRFFLFVPTQAAYRSILLDGHDPLNAAYPDRYKRFIRSGDDSHTTLGSDLYYVGEADGVPFYQWLNDFLTGRRGKPSWIDIVEDFVPLP